MAYGYNVDPEGPDYMLALADDAVKKIFSEASEPGKWLVDIIPARTSYTYKYHAYGALMHVWYRVTVKYLPEWLPGSGFKKTARQWRKTVYRAYNIPFDFVERQMASRWI